MMNTGCRMEVLSHYIVPLKLMLHCMLTSWNLNKNLREKKNPVSCEKLKNLARLVSYTLQKKKISGS